jgi:hypothetical protein
MAYDIVVKRPIPIVHYTSYAMSYVLGGIDVLYRTLLLARTVPKRTTSNVL